MTYAPVTDLTERVRAKHDVSPIAPYDARAIPWHVAALRDKSRILLATGSKGGGKSRFAAEKMHSFCLKYPGATGLVVRKTRETLTNSTVLFMQQQVIGGDKRVKFLEGKHRFEYQHNGSFLAYGGMKDAEQREQVRSMGANGGLDIIWMEEANAFEETDFSELIGCLRGVAAPWRELIMTTNPDGPDHWIRRKFILPATQKLSDRVFRGEVDGNVFTVYYSGAADNPFNPPDYQNTLNLLTGIEYQRLVLGQWVQAEGVVYDNFSAEDGANVLNVDYTPNQPFYWGVDDGYVMGGGPGTESYHPRVFLAAQPDGLGGFNILLERYRTGEASYEESIEDSGVCVWKLARQLSPIWSM
jgi:PBSX family phage terminase large subunit